MVGTEVTLQIVATLSGAALVSVLLIAFINAEAKSRITHQGGEIEGSSMWKVFANKLSHLASSKNENSTESGAVSRKLQWAEEEKHHVRHGKHKGTRRGTQILQVQQDSCYSGNEVLVIIGVTCLLNFAFVLLVMACVHYCSSKNERIPRLESVLIESESDSTESRRDWDRRNSLLSLHNLPLYRHKTPSQSMEQLLFLD